MVHYVHGTVNESISIIEKFGKLIRHVHLHDNFGGQSQADGLHLPIGDGTVDFSALDDCYTSSRFSLEFGIWLPNTFWGGKLWVE